jgi:hypothetical protein
VRSSRRSAQHGDTEARRGPDGLGQQRSASRWAAFTSVAPALRAGGKWNVQITSRSTRQSRLVILHIPLATARPKAGRRDRRCERGTTPNPPRPRASVCCTAALGEDAAITKQVTLKTGIGATGPRHDSRTDPCSRARQGVSKVRESPVAADELALRARERTAELSSGGVVLAERGEPFAEGRTSVNR